MILIQPITMLQSKTVLLHVVFNSILLGQKDLNIRDDNFFESLTFCFYKLNWKVVYLDFKIQNSYFNNLDVSKFINTNNIHFNFYQNPNYFSEQLINRFLLIFLPRC